MQNNDETLTIYMLQVNCKEFNEKKIYFNIIIQYINLYFNEPRKKFNINKLDKKYNIL